MNQDINANRIEMIRRLNASGFQSGVVDQILSIADAMLKGSPALAHVLVAATEVCKTCQLSRTHRYIADALTCLVDEVRQDKNPSVDDKPVARLMARGLAMPERISNVVA